jgi:hypothetical protein
VFGIIGIGAFMYGRLEKKGIIKEKIGIFYFVPIVWFVIATIEILKRNVGFTGERPLWSVADEKEMIPIVLFMTAWGVFRLLQSVHIRRNIDKFDDIYMAKIDMDALTASKKYRILGALYIICGGWIGFLAVYAVPYIWKLRS